MQNNLASMIKEKKLFLLDIDGTVALGSELLPGAADFLQTVKENGGIFRFLTNNSSKAASDYVEQFHDWGIETTEEEFINEVANEVNHSKLGDELEEAFNHDYYIAVSIQRPNIMRIYFANNAFEYEYGRRISLHDLYEFIKSEQDESMSWFIDDSWLAYYIGYYMRKNKMYRDPDDVEEAINHITGGSIAFNGLFETYFASNSSNRKED